ncbi:translation initiation factor IF-2 [uncultured Desulfovibrio sp.]|uniref:translation initiation factor IF-2 n=1 Tax=uncultured Desulfovibrio sp. TaxID=167968 RepID=UPI002614BC89|nr:translation initiation factor IF-2 [uncultured Desulfovibrio sp.]
MLRRLRRILPCALLAVSLFSADAALAGSVYSPRHSGLEPPGGPRSLESLPGGRSAGRTDDGGMGYTDAYGRRLENKPPERKVRNRPSPGAYGGYGRQEEAVRPLPEVEKPKPAWNFN